MGYHMYLKETDFKILKENHDAALKAIKELAGNETIKDSSGMHFSWVDTEDFLDARTIYEAFDAWRWYAVPNEDGDIINLDFRGEKLGDDLLFFNAIAPYVEDGFIQMEGEDDYVWRWAFKNGVCKEVVGEVTITFPG